MISAFVRLGTAKIPAGFKPMIIAFRDHPTCPRRKRVLGRFLRPGSRSDSRPRTAPASGQSRLRSVCTQGDRGGSGRGRALTLEDRVRVTIVLELRPQSQLMREAVRKHGTRHDEPKPGMGSTGRCAEAVLAGRTITDDGSCEHGPVA
jgi:hypothetical protein